MLFDLYSKALGGGKYFFDQELEDSVWSRRFDVHASLSDHSVPLSFLHQPYALNWVFDFVFGKTLNVYPVFFILVDYEWLGVVFCQ